MDYCFIRGGRPRCLRACFDATLLPRLHTQTSGFFFNEGRLQRNTYNGDFGKQVRGDGEKKNPLQRCNQLLQSMEEGHRKAKCVQL